MEGERRGSSREIRARARELRRAATAAEERLWNGLRGWGIARFRRQHPLDGLVLDFYCHAVKLCVEVDGEVHDHQAQRDAARTTILETRGIKVIRFRNEEVMADTRAVLFRIKDEVRAREKLLAPDR
jgi:very-short-patch-repair endonuclease